MFEKRSDKTNVNTKPS